MFTWFHIFQKKALTGDSKGEKEEKPEDDGWTKYQEPILLQMLATNLEIETKSIIDFELNLYDTQKASLGEKLMYIENGYVWDWLHVQKLIWQNLWFHFGYIVGGAYSEFIHSARLDNLASCFLAVKGLVDHVENELDNDEDVSLVALFDHEEIGSTSA